MREKRHKGVEKGDKAFLESLYYTKERVNIKVQLMVARQRVEGCDLHGVNDTERVAGDPVVIRQRKLLLRVRASRRWMR